MQRTQEDWKFEPLIAKSKKKETILALLEFQGFFNSDPKDTQHKVYVHVRPPHSSFQ